MKIHLEVQNLCTHPHFPKTCSELDCCLWRVDSGLMFDTPDIKHNTGHGHNDKLNAKQIIYQF